MTSRIVLENVKIYAYHGVLPEENLIGTYYIVNLSLDVPLWKAGETDDLNDTVNYAAVNEVVHQQMRVQSKLLEHVAKRIINAIEKQFPTVEHITIKITKTSPPMEGELDGVSVELSKALNGTLN